MQGRLTDDAMANPTRSDTKMNEDAGSKIGWLKTAETNNNVGQTGTEIVASVLLPGRPF